MGALRERGTSNVITVLLTSALMTQMLAIRVRESMNTGDKVFNNPQRPLVNLHPAVVRMLMTKPSPGSPGVSFGVQATLSSIFTVTTSQGERLG